MDVLCILADLGKLLDRRVAEYLTDESKLADSDWRFFGVDYISHAVVSQLTVGLRDYVAKGCVVGRHHICDNKRCGVVHRRPWVASTRHDSTIAQ